MRTLTPEEIERLRRVDRQVKISMSVALTVLVACLVPLIVAGLDVPVVAGVPLGVMIGLLLLIPRRRTLSELGLSPAQGREVLRADLLRRTGVGTLPAETRARREIVLSRIWLTVGLTALLVLVIAAPYLVSRAGQTVAEDAPADVWFGISFFGAFAALAVVPGAFCQAKKNRGNARALRVEGTGNAR